ncbi:hypothetical protein [Rhizobium phage RHph_X3_2]|nr:hypothetical protein [Rhizobium phage RHph_X3_2]
MILGVTYIACIAGDTRQTLAVPMEMGLTRKYDLLSQRHEIYLLVRPYTLENVEMVLIKGNSALAQEILPFEEERIIDAATKLVREADVAHLVRLSHVVPQADQQVAGRLQ